MTEGPGSSPAQNTLASGSRRTPRWGAHKSLGERRFPGNLGLTRPHHCHTERLPGDLPGGQSAMPTFHRRGNRGEVCADRALSWRDLTESCRTEHPVRTGSRRAGEGSYAPGQVQGHDAPCPSPRGDRHSPMSLLRCFPTRLLDSSLPLRNANLPRRQEGGAPAPQDSGPTLCLPMAPHPGQRPIHTAMPQPWRYFCPVSGAPSIHPSRRILHPSPGAAPAACTQNP